MRHVFSSRISACNTTAQPISSEAIRPRALVLGIMSTVAALAPITAQANGLSMTSEGPGTPEGGAGSEFSSSQISLTLPLAQQANRREQLRSFFHIDQTSFELEGTSAAQNDYFWLSMPIQYQQRRSRKSEFTINLEPGFMTDLKSLDSDAIGLNLELYGRQYRGRSHRGDGSFWQYGVVLDRAFGDYRLRPAVAASWAASRDTRVLLGFPRTRVTTQWGSSLSSFLHIRPAGGVWREEIDGQTGSFSVNYRNWRVGVGGEFHWRGHLWLTGEFGQTRLRTLTASDSSGAKVTSRPGDDTYTQFGVRLVF